MTAPLRLFWMMPEYPPDPGGIGTFASEVAPELARRGHTVQLLSTFGTEPLIEKFDGLVVQRAPIRRAFERGAPAEIARFRRQLADLKATFQPDVYQLCITDPTPILHLMTSEIAPAPTVLTLQSEVFDIFSTDGGNTLLSRLVEASTVITGVSGTVSRQAAVANPRAAHRIVTIRNAVTCGVNPTLLPGSQQLLAIARLVSQKGLDRLIRAMPAVVDRHPGARLDILGEGPERPSLEATIESLHLEHIVTLRGHVERHEVAEYLERAQLVVAPSVHEGLPFAVLEAALHGRPVIGSRIGGTDEAIEHGVTGLLIEQELLDNDPTVLADAIGSLLDDPQRAQAMGTAGRNRVDRHFSAATCVDSFERVYRAVTCPPVEVAIIIPAYNNSSHLAATLESVLRDLESTEATAQVLVVDDGSTDNTVDIASSFANRGVEVFLQPHLGTAMARNAGIALTSSTHIAHFDADDIWPLGRLAALLEPLEADDRLEAAFGAAVEFADADAPPNAAWSAEPRIVRSLTAGLIRRTAHDRLGGYRVDASATMTHDNLQWSTHAIARGLRYATVDQVVIRRRIHANNQSHKNPFTRTSSRVTLVKRALDARRASGELDSR